MREFGADGARATLFVISKAQEDRLFDLDFRCLGSLCAWTQQLGQVLASALFAGLATDSFVSLHTTSIERILKMLLVGREKSLLRVNWIAKNDSLTSDSEVPRSPPVAPLRLVAVGSFLDAPSSAAAESVSADSAPQ